MANKAAFSCVDFKESTLIGPKGMANKAAFSCMEFKESTLIGPKGMANRATFSCVEFKEAVLNKRKRRGAFWQDALLTQG